MGQALKIVVLVVVIAAVSMAAAALTAVWFLVRPAATLELPREALTFHAGDLLAAFAGPVDALSETLSPQQRERLAARFMTPMPPFFARSPASPPQL
jgi:hypothetical protein